MTAYLPEVPKFKKPTETKIESRRMPDAKTRVGNDGRIYGQSFKELHLKAYNKPPFLEGRNFPIEK